MSAGPLTAPVGSIDELERVKEAETEWAKRVGDARAKAEAELKRLRGEAEERLERARAAAQKAREARIEAAQKEADQEAARILADGEAQAKTTLNEPGKRPQDREADILRVVLREFQPD